jgi:uncharacterized membrane protein
MLADLRSQVVADGLFHGLMYIVVLVGLVLFVKAQGAWSTPVPPRRFAALVLIGFGAWHGVDAVLSHWILGIHRVRMDVGNPLFWDVAWLLVFGAIPFGIGMAMRRGDGGATLKVANVLRSPAACR